MRGMRCKSLSNFQNANVAVDFTFLFVAVVISPERLVVRRHFSSFMSPFQSRAPVAEFTLTGPHFAVQESATVQTLHRKNMFVVVISCFHSTLRLKT